MRTLFLLTLQKNERFGSAYFRVGVGSNELVKIYYATLKCISLSRTLTWDW